MGATLEGDPSESLAAFAEQYLTHLFSEQGVKLLRGLLSESHRNPRLGRIFYALGPVRVREGLETYLEACKAERLINAPDCAHAVRAVSTFMRMYGTAAMISPVIETRPACNAAEIHLR